MKAIDRSERSCILLSPRSYRSSLLHRLMYLMIFVKVAESFTVSSRVVEYGKKVFGINTPVEQRNYNYDPVRLRHWTDLRAQRYRSGDDTPPRGIFELLNDEVSEQILERLNQKLGGSESVPIGGAMKKKASKALASDGLSKFHQSILATTSRRQRCVTGKYPLRITVKENPTRKWLGTASSQMLVNGTSVERSLASYDRFQWLEEDERALLHEGHSLFSLELLAEINLKKPGYVHVLPASSAGFAAKRRKEDAEIWKQKYRLNYEERRKAKNIYGTGDDLTSERDRIERILEAERERLWITGFSLTKQSGEVHYVDVESGSMGSISGETSSAIRWPNEVNSVPIQSYGENKKEDYPGVDDVDDAILVSDGFLVPGRDNGGLYVVFKPGHESDERRVCLTGGNGVDGMLSRLESGEINSVDESGWFYHRSVWIDLTNDGRQSVLTARAKRPSISMRTDEKSSRSLDSPTTSLKTEAQLVWLERPKPFRIDELTGTPLDKDGLVFDPFSPKHTPWKVRVLEDGPDVMFSVADMDTTDDTIEVFASQFFSKKLTMHSIRRGVEPAIVFSRTIDNRCGASFSSILANLDMTNATSHPINSSTRRVVDSGSTVPTLKSGDSFSHLLITSHESTFADKSEEERGFFERENTEEYISDIRTGSKELASIEPQVDGGSLFSYRVPEGKDGWKTEQWLRTVIATGFRVKGQLGNMINPGAPGFCYTFYPTKQAKSTSSRPLIGIAGDCAESAFILRPIDSDDGEDPSANYTMMCEIECGATVGSIGIGYEDFCYAPQQSEYVKIYLPCYENDKVLVFALGSGEDTESTDGW